MSFPVGRLAQAQLEERYDRWIIKTAPVTLQAAEQDIVIEQGRRLYVAIEWREYRGDDGTEAEAVPDLASWTFTLKVAREYGGAALITLTGAPLGDDAKVVGFELTPTLSAALTGWSRGVYDIMATKTGQAIRLVQGCATLSPAAAAAGA